MKQRTKNIFYGLNNLRVLWLTGNHIEKDEDIYPLALKLQNQITTLHHDVFLPLQSSLYVLLLHHNQMSNVNEDLIQSIRNIQNLKVIKLLDNRLSKMNIQLVLDEFNNKWNKGTPICKYGQSSKGECLQLDLMIDSGDNLEDLWDEKGIALAELYIFQHEMKNILMNNDNDNYNRFEDEDDYDENREEEEEEEEGGEGEEEGEEEEEEEDGRKYEL